MQDPLDRAKLAELRALMPAHFIRDSIGMFLSRAASSIPALREALERGDLQQLERGAHGLKGSAGIIGARRVMEIASEIEALTRAGGGEDLRPLVETLAQEFVHTRAALEAEQRDLGAE